MRESAMAPNTQLKRGLLAVVVLTVAALGTMWLMWPEPASFRRIELDMTQAEIEALIGLPPGRYPGRRFRPDFAGSKRTFIRVLLHRHESSSTRSSWRPLEFVVPPADRFELR
jgi:hypothetical protein